MKSDFACLAGCTFGRTANDPCMVAWEKKKGPYVTNGLPMGVVKRSNVADGDPDLFFFGGPVRFRGYFPGYSNEVSADKRHFSWTVLKAHTNNRAGTVTLRSADPRDVPRIEFNHFETGTTDQGAHERDLQALAEGVAFARRMGTKAGDLMLDDLPIIGGKFEEELPGRTYASDEAVKEFVKNEAWGHHASCTCPMGNDSDPMAVLDSRLRVRGTTGLRVVDASIFPHIPGFFIVAPIYMASEKATDVLLEEIGECRNF